MIQIDKAKNDLKVTAGYLAERYFDFMSIIKHCSGWSIPNGGKPYYLVSMSQYGRLTKALAKCGFDCTVSAAVTEEVSHMKREESKHLLEVEKFISQYNKKMAKKGLTIREYQAEDIAVLHTRRRMLLCNPVGTGKSMTALLSIPKDYQVVIIAPANVLAAWRNELIKWELSDGSDITELPRSQSSWDLPAKFTLVSSSSIPTQDVNWGKYGNRIAVVVDEAHQYTNWKAKRTERLQKMCDAVVRQDGMLLPLTASPMKNHYGELLQLLRCFHLLQQSFGSVNSFFAEYRGRKGEYGLVWDGPTNPAESRAILDRVMIMRDRRDIVDQLPDYSYETLSVRLTVSELRAIEKEVPGLTLADLEEGLRSRRGPSFERLSAVSSLLAQAKAKAAAGTVSQYLDNNTPLVVMSRSKQALHRLREFLPADARVAFLTGDETTTKREGVRLDFFAGKHTVVLCTIGACYQGIDLTAANTMLFLDRDFVPEINVQCRGRIDRWTQKSKGLTYINVVSNHPLDIRLDEILNEKERNIKNVFNKS